MSHAFITRRGGNNKGGSFPKFTYTGLYTSIDDGDGNWRIKFLTSGVLVFSRFGLGDGTIDAFCAGGGGGRGHFNGGSGRDNYGYGGGGYTSVLSGAIMQEDEEYNISIGDGGATTGSDSGGSGGDTSLLGPGVSLSASGGKGGTSTWGSPYGGNGGSGGGMHGTYSATGGADGSNASGHSNGGKGQGSTTREFAEANNTLYSYGGYNSSISTLIQNTGNGNTGGSPGSSGICVIRNHRS